MGWRKSETMINSREFHRQFGAKKLYILNKFFAYFWIVKGMCNGRERERIWGGKSLFNFNSLCEFATIDFVERETNSY